MLKNRVFKYTFLFLIGGFAYYFLEIATRGYSHYSMIICGGLCFIFSGLLNQIFGWEIALISQMVISSLIITSLEFITGIIVNLCFRLNVWDYSDIPYNILGQVCLKYTLIWFLLSLVCIFVDDWIRYALFGEEKPRYKLL